MSIKPETHNAPPGERAELRKTEILGWLSIALISGSMVPALVIASDMWNFMVGLLFALLCPGLAGLILWYTRVRYAIRKLFRIRERMEARARDQENALDRIRNIESTQRSFMKMASHQLRAPLAAMQSCLKVLLEGNVKDVEDVKKLLGDAHTRGEDMLELVNDMLGLAKSESGLLIEESAPAETIDVEESVRDIVDFFSARAAEKNVTFRVNVISPPGVIEANQRLFSQVVLNLVSNAFRYSFPGREVVINLSSTDSDTVIFEIVNWGIVIPEEDKKSIFMEFWRSDDARKFVERGTGLGLSIVKNIIDFRGGTIDVQSDRDRGTRFTVEIPRTRKRGA